MFNSTILDVVIGLVSVFLAISLIASALTEALASVMALRAKTLLSGIQQLLNDPHLEGLALDLYNHALVNPLSDGKTAAGQTPVVRPSYIDPQHFASALIDGIQNGSGNAAALKQDIDVIQNQQIKTTLTALYNRAGKDAGRFRDEVAEWFNNAMDRVSGNYKRLTAVISFVIALLAAGLLNADPIRIAGTIWQRPELASQMAKLQLPSGTVPAADTALPVVQQIEGTGLLMGWEAAGDDPSGNQPLRYVLMILGWGITAGAALFGAPFWFDLLQRIVQLRGTGPAPGG